MRKYVYIMYMLLEVSNFTINIYLAMFSSIPVISEYEQYFKIYQFIEVNVLFSKFYMVYLAQSFICSVRPKQDSIIDFPPFV